MFIPSFCWTHWHAPRMPTGCCSQTWFNKWKNLLKTRCPLNVMRACAHQTTLMTFKHSARSLAKHVTIIIAYFAQFIQTNLMEFCHFCFPVLFQRGLRRPSLLSTFYFKWSVFWEKTGFHTHCQSFSLLIPPYLYFSIIFIFLPHISWVCWHWC